MTAILVRRHGSRFPRLAQLGFDPVARVRTIHSGYEGPGMGARHAKLVAELTGLVPSARRTRFAAGSIDTSSASSTQALSWRRRTRQIGWAISAGDSPAVASW